MLHHIEIDQFKQITGFKETLNRLTVLVGTNNSGKSSVLHAIHSCVALAQSRLQLSNTESMNTEETNFSISVPDTLYLPLLNVDWLAPDGGLTQSRGPNITMQFDDAESSQGTIQIRRGKNRNLAVKLKGRTVGARIETIAEPFSVYVPGLAGISKTETFTAYGSLLRIIARGDANMVLRNVLLALHSHKDSNKWKEFLESVKKIFPERTLEVRFKPEMDEHINVVVKQGDHEIPLDCTGTGFLQTVQILSYIYLFDPEVTLLDEPDSHLHPNNQRELAEMLWSLAVEGRTQIILATHSRHLIDVFKEKETAGILWMRNGKVQPYKSGIDMLADLGAFDSAEGLLTKGVDFVVLTEDRKKALIKQIFKANGAKDEKFQVWAYKGCSNLDTAEVVGKFIHEISPKTKVIVHRDSDYLSDEDKNYWKQQFENLNMTVFFPPTVDLEGILCNVDHLKQTNPGHEKEVQEAFDEGLKACSALFREKAQKGRLEVDNKRHRSGQPTEGKVAIKTWAAELDVESPRWRHGKEFLSAVARLYKTATKKNLQYTGSTKYLAIPELKEWIKETKAS